ncbi:MAG TPA: twin-arginine translocase TatA/TatE family subunit [Candidatus Limnocylindrales bacterium]
MPDTLLVLLVILGAVLVWRGPKNLPKLGEALGRGVREARKEAAAHTGDEPPVEGATADETPVDAKPVNAEPATTASDSDSRPGA